MKKPLATLFLFSALGLSAQKYLDTNDPNDQEIKSLLNKDNDLNGFGGTTLKLGDVHEERTLITGAYGGVLINRSFMLGIAGYGIATDTQFEGSLPDGIPRTLNIKGGYAGLVIGGTIFSRELIHVNFPTLLGAGAIYVSDEDFFQNTLETDFTIETSAYFVLEPAAEVEFNITRGLRFAAGASYRYVLGLELMNLTNEDLTDWMAQVSLRFGRF